jgi:hypothetical protein
LHEIVYMKKLCLTLIAFTFLLHQLSAGCGAGQWQVIVSVVGDNYPSETSWSLYDANTGAFIDSGKITRDTVCVGALQCLKFTIYDSYGDGICCSAGTGNYKVTMNGATVASGGHFGFSESTFFNCPPGHDCSGPIAATIDTITAPGPETWYSFIPDSSGIYNIRTCSLGNTCDTKIYIYDHCVGIVLFEDNQGTTFYAQDNCDSTQEQITGAFAAGKKYYIRIGDNQDNCTGEQITWLIEYAGPITGCTDPNACNYNALATISNGDCLYPPNILCPGPDLTVVQDDLTNSIYLDSITVNATDCFIGEGCLAGYGTRGLIRFTTHIRNIGDADYFIGAADTTSDQFVYDACHQHWHYVGYAEYLLYDGSDHVVRTGYKSGFCVEDLECDSLGLGKFGCGTMGISTGCGDEYSAEINCQWIDITGIDTGNYKLLVGVNWDQKADKLGHWEKTYANNWAQVCFNLYYGSHGEWELKLLPACPPYIDCAGDTFGSSQLDCKDVCNGSAVRGDVNSDFSADSNDVQLYLNGIVDDNITYTPCTDLNSDSDINIIDAIWLNGCLLYQRGLHHYASPNYQNPHGLCEFPHNIFNPADSVVFSIAAVNWQSRYVDLSIFNPRSYLLAYELRLQGLIIDSVTNLISSYHPGVSASAMGHLASIALEENLLSRQPLPINLLRVYYSALTDTQICIQQVVAVVDGNYEVVRGVTRNACAAAMNTGLSQLTSLPIGVSVIPNPGTGKFDIYSANHLLAGAKFNIIDLQGKTVSSFENNGLVNNFTIDLSNRDGGIYFLTINLDGQIVTKRLVLLGK